MAFRLLFGFFLVKRQKSGFLLNICTPLLVFSPKQSFAKVTFCSPAESRDKSTPLDRNKALWEWQKAARECSTGISYLGKTWSNVVWVMLGLFVTIQALAFGWLRNSSLKPLECLNSQEWLGFDPAMRTFCLDTASLGSPAIPNFVEVEFNWVWSAVLVPSQINSPRAAGMWFSKSPAWFMELRGKVGIKCAGSWRDKSAHGTLVAPPHP